MYKASTRGARHLPDSHKAVQRGAIQLPKGMEGMYKASTRGARHV